MHNGGDVIKYTLKFAFLGSSLSDGRKAKAQSGTALNHMKTAASFSILALRGAANQKNQTLHL